MTTVVHRSDYANRNWVLTPWPDGSGWLAVLTGICLLPDFHGEADGTWHRDAVLLSAADLIGEAISQRQAPSMQNRGLGFVVDQWAPGAGLNAIYNEGQSVNAGYAV